MSHYSKHHFITQYISLRGTAVNEFSRMIRMGVAGHVKPGLHRVRNDRNHVLATMSQRAYYSSPVVDCKNLLWKIATIKNIVLPCEKNCLLITPIILTASLIYGQLFKISSIIPSVFVTQAMFTLYQIGFCSVAKVASIQCEQEIMSCCGAQIVPKHSQCEHKPYPSYNL